jgi:hypothetical protein
MRERIVGGAVLILILAGALLFWQSRRGRLEPPVVLAEIKRLNQLATVRYSIQRVVGIKEEKQPVGSESILLIVQARVDAGINLDLMRPPDVAVGKDGSVSVRLPPPTILDVSIDEKNTKVWDRQKTWWTPWVPFSLDLEQRARIAGLEGARQAALDMGILRNAEQNARDSVRVLLELAGAKNVVIVSATAM